MQKTLTIAAKATAQDAALSAGVITLMEIEPRLTTYVVSSIGGYFMAFFIASAVVAVVSGSGAIVLIPVFVFSLIVAIPVAIISAGIGYPVFSFVFRKVQIRPIPRLILAGGLSCIGCIISYATAVNLFLGSERLPESIAGMAGIFLILCVAVIPCSAIVYWYIEK